MYKGVWAWEMISSKYVVQSVKNVEKHLKGNLSKRWKLPSKTENPFDMGYAPELDIYPELDAFHWLRTISRRSVFCVGWLS